MNMRLNSQTDFSLRLLMYLAAKPGGTATIQEASRRMGLSQTHMMRVAAKLASTGFLTSNRGRSGGICLSRDAASITVEEVVRAVEPGFSLVECFEPSGTCVFQPGCLLKGVLHSAMEAFFAELRTVTLNQLVSPNDERLHRVLGWSDPARRLMVLDQEAAMPAAAGGEL
jgi:Rrf2 family nitric oxide-sensitive transcriptional repressor